MNTGLQVLYSSLCQWNLDSGFQSPGFGFYEQSFSGFRNSESLRWHESVLLNHNIVIAITLFPCITCAFLFIRCLPNSDLGTDTDCDTITTFRTFENVSRESGLFYFRSTCIVVNRLCKFLICIICKLS